MDVLITEVPIHSNFLPLWHGAGRGNSGCPLSMR